MTRKPSNPFKSSNLSRCRHLFPGGRRCRLHLSPKSTFFCRTHAHLQPPADTALNLDKELSANVEKFTSAAGINQFLTNLLKLLSEDRITPRRGAVIAYTCNLILRTLPAIENELHPDGARNDRPQVVIWDMPGPNPEDNTFPADVAAWRNYADGTGPLPDRMPSRPGEPGQTRRS
ncbi:MAG: hypothetical protein WBF35_11405 [Candidatus Acidiferrales bacterium]